ncbi:MAG: deoxyguanosinetriphosphate triphosphohydrolase-like protein [Candidatus Pelagibacterales bacterium]|nr:MAG: deoxyguanosinetriphosphate triphosphohydrolase-like protein [Pelagibacterales bacterium]
MSLLYNKNLCYQFYLVMISEDLSFISTNQETSKGRLYKENYSQTRSEFQRDRDRILHSAAFRRLKHKTQVFVSNEGDHYRTRLTHSLEVSQIARSISKIFNLNEDLTETLSLSHDIGHPPFGHAGEDALSECMVSHEGFDHNDQAIRIVHLLEKKYFDFEGLNLTWETLEGLVKHNGPMTKDVPKTIEALNKEFDLKLNEFSSIEAQIASIADDIAYNNHDLDDGLRAGFFSYDDLVELPMIGEIIKNFPKNYNSYDMQRINNEITRKSTSIMITDVINTISEKVKKSKVRCNEDVRLNNEKIADFSDKTKEEVKYIRSFLSMKMYNHDKVKAMTSNAHQIISSLFKLFIEQDEKFIKEHMKKIISDEDKPRAVCDFIAGMTDNYAQNFYNKFN